MVSTDAGVRWSQVIKISNFGGSPRLRLRTGLRPGHGGSGAGRHVHPGHRRRPGHGSGVYVVWADARFSGGEFPDVVLSSSLDGRTWTTPVKVNQTPVAAAAFNPTVEVSSDGTVGVVYYDFRENDPTPDLPTTVLLAHSHDAGVTWDEQQVDGPFDMQNAPFARGLFLGDYQGLDLIGTDFLAFYSRSHQGDTGLGRRGGCRDDRPVAVRRDRDRCGSDASVPAPCVPGRSGSRSTGTSWPCSGHVCPPLGSAPPSARALDPRARALRSEEQR